MTSVCHWMDFTLRHRSWKGNMRGTFYQYYSFKKIYHRWIRNKVFNLIIAYFRDVTTGLSEEGKNSIIFTTTTTTNNNPNPPTPPMCLPPFSLEIVWGRSVLGKYKIPVCVVLSQLNNLHAICNSDPKSTNNKSSPTAIHYSTLIIILTPVVQDQREITPFTDLKCCLHETNVWIVWVYIVHFPFSLFFFL